MDECVTLKNVIHVCSIMKMVALLHSFMYVFECRNMPSFSAELCKRNKSEGDEVRGGGKAAANQNLHNPV